VNQLFKHHTHSKSRYYSHQDQQPTGKLLICMIEPLSRRGKTGPRQWMYRQSTGAEQHRMSSHIELHGFSILIRRAISHMGQRGPGATAPCGHIHRTILIIYQPRHSGSARRGTTRLDSTSFAALFAVPATALWRSTWLLGRQIPGRVPSNSAPQQHMPCTATTPIAGRPTSNGPASRNRRFSQGHAPSDRQPITRMAPRGGRGGFCPRAAQTSRTRCERRVIIPWQYPTRVGGHYCTLRARETAAHCRATGIGRGKCALTSP